MAKKRACGCMKKVEKELAQFNTRLAMIFDFQGNAVASVETEKIESRGKRKKIVAASHCPFCGEKYPHIT